jgi:hypothetical protein
MDPVQLTGAWAEVIKTGLLGTLLFLSWGIIIYLYRHNQKCTEDQHNTEMEVVKGLNEVAKAINGFTIAADANSRSDEARTLAAVLIEKEVNELRHSNEKAVGQINSRLDLILRGNLGDRGTS